MTMRATHSRHDVARRRRAPESWEASPLHAGRPDARLRPAHAWRTATAGWRTRCPARPRPGAAGAPQTRAHLDPRPPPSASLPAARRRSRTPGCGGPTTAGGRCTSPSGSSSQVQVRLRPARRMELAPRRSSTARGRAGSFSASTATNHCSDTHGSSVVSQR